MRAIEAKTNIFRNFDYLFVNNYILVSQKNTLVLESLSAAFGPYNMIQFR